MLWRLLDAREQKNTSHQQHLANPSSASLFKSSKKQKITSAGPSPAHISHTFSIQGLKAVGFSQMIQEQALELAIQKTSGNHQVSQSRHRSIFHGSLASLY